MSCSEVTVRVLFSCRLCADSFDQVTDFISHKKENHFQEFLHTTCIVFEDKPLSNSSNAGYVECSSFPSSSPLVKLETFDDARLNLKLEPEPETESKGFITATQHHFQHHFEGIPTKIETIENVSTFEPEIQPQEYKNPVVLLKRISSKKILNFSKNHSYEESDEERRSTSNLGKASHWATQVDITTQVLPCKLCDKAFSSEPQLRIHVQICPLYNNNKSNPANCATCNNFFANTQQLHDHIELCHGNRIAVDTSNTSASSSVSVSFRKKSGKQSNYVPISSSNSKQNPPRKSKFFKVFDRVEQDSLDNDNHHCTTFAEPDPLLLLHKKIKRNINSSDSKCFKCPFSNCQSVFKLKFLLQSHVRTHTGERPFKCPVPNCGKAFTHIGTLYNHKTLTHSDSCTFKCPDPSCDKAFKAIRYARRHFKAVHYKKKLRQLGRRRKHGT